MKLKLFLVLVLFSSAFAQNQGSKPRSIFMAEPESDSITTFSSKHGLSASTLPGSSVTLNDKPLKVYSSGAFTGQLDLQPGENHFTIKSVTPSGETITRSFTIFRKKRLETTPKDSLVIEDAMMEPSRDMWFDGGDVLFIRFKGTPGCKAYFGNGAGNFNPMREMPLSETGGLGGVYQYTYKVKPTDMVAPLAIQFKLEDENGKSVTKSSKATISMMGEKFPILGVTKGERPYLNFGLGEDRLGGAKMGFLVPGVKVKINGKAGNQYRVQLSDKKQAWIPEDQIDTLPSGTYLPTALTGSWGVYGDEKYDYVTVDINEKLPFTSEQDPQNKRIIIDVYGAVSNSNWITQHLTTKEIKNVYYEQPEKDVFRIIIELKHKQLWGYNIDYRGGTLIIKVKRQPKDLDFENLTFAIDAGHGGPNLGAVGATGSEEKAINLSTVYHLKELLEKKGAKVVLTRKDDSSVNNGERLRGVLNSGADILISIHSNATGSSSDPGLVKGISTYYKYIGFRPLSTFIYDEVLKTGLQPFGNVGSFNFTLNSATELPSVLVELAFMSNPEDEMKLMDDEFRQELAEKIVKGVQKFLDYCDED
ncbi:MAG: N-acetylmuramoyl-L-alanine amidase [Ignavibacteriales bacterium]